MLTFQDLQAVGAADKDRAEFVRKVINEHKSSELYRTAKTADEYDRCRNTTIMQHQKMIATVTGKVIPDTYSANHKSTSNFFNIFVTQENQYLLGNGVEWNDKATEGKLGSDFDQRLQEAGKAALVGGVSFGFWNLDHLEVFKALEFAPLYDEENGALAAGVRFWQIDSSKPLRATLYEMDGYTNYLWSENNWIYLQSGDAWQKIDENIYAQPKRQYKLKIRESEADGAEIYAGENYPSFPIVPLWGNPLHQSVLVGTQEKIDAYDFILNGFENDLDNAQIYWIIQGAGGMDDVDLAKFLDRLRTVAAVAPEDGQNVQPVPVEIPSQARELLLDRLEKRLYKDAMALNPDDIAGGAATATQIRAAYEPLNSKTDQYEYCVIDFLHGILKVAGIVDEPTFTRSVIVNTQEEVQTIVTAGKDLSQEYRTRKILALLGDSDKADEVLAQIDAEDAERLGNIPTESEETE